MENLTELCSGNSQKCSQKQPKILSQTSGPKFFAIYDDAILEAENRFNEL